MMRLSPLVGLLLVLPLAGCDNTPGGGVSVRPGGNDEDIWAIRCLTLNTPNRFDLTKSYAGALEKVNGLKPELVQVFHEDSGSSIYYGRYGRKYDARKQTESFRPDPLKDLDLIRHLSINVADPATGTRTVWPFGLATMDTLPSSRGVHPEWLLTKAPGYYSLQVGVFYNSGEMRRRKFAAEEYCKLLREQGHDAYYHHGPVNSSVCIGAFPKEAIQTFQRQDSLTGIIRVTSKIVDENMLKLQRKFPHNLHNGAKFFEIRHDPKTGQKRREAHTSFAVEIPRDDQGTSAFEG